MVFWVNDCWSGFVYQVNFCGIEGVVVCFISSLQVNCYWVVDEVVKIKFDFVYIVLVIEVNGQYDCVGVSGIVIGCFGIEVVWCQEVVIICIYWYSNILIKDFWIF